MNLLQHIISSITMNGNFCVLGIDGPTASGKTTLANNLRDSLIQMEIPVLIFQMDWCLTDREQRLKDVDGIFTKKQSFELEADKHMNLIKAAEFFHFVDKYRHADFDNVSIRLKGLYNRDDEGKCNGVANLKLEKGMVVIVEGHYTHHRILRRFFDLNYLLIAKEDNLLKRKILRVGSYRDEANAANYFKWIDMPSFWHYFLKNTCFFENIFQNDFFDNQYLLSIDQVPEFLFSNNPKTDYYRNDFNSISQFIFQIVKSIHDEFIHLWGISVQYRKTSLSECLNNSFVQTEYFVMYSYFDLNDCNYFSYHYGLKAEDKFVLVIGDLNTIKIIIADTFNKRMYSLVCDNNGFSGSRNFKTNSPIEFFNSNIHVIAPNKFLIPSFLANNNYISNKLYIKEEDVWDLAKEIFFSNCFFILRIKNDQQKVFTEELLNLLDYEVAKIGNYFYAEKIKDKKLIDQHRKFANNYFIFQSNNNSDSIPKEEIKTLDKIGCKFRDDNFYFQENSDLKSLSTFYKKASLNTKKKLTKSLYDYFPNIEVAKNVPLSSYISSLPISLKEFYLALSISQKGSVPFLSIYDVKPGSFDIQTYFEFFTSQKLPFGFQASLNALGTKKNSGYLNVDGPEVLAKAIKQNLIAFLQKNPVDNIPLWNLGIDHAVFTKDSLNNGFEFVQEAIKSQWFLSFCIDLSDLLPDNLKNIQNKTINKVLNGLFSNVLTKEQDIEFYIGNEKVFNKISGEKALEIYSEFSKLFYEKAKAHDFEFNFLFGPYLGTRHHQAHVQINPEKSKEIFKTTLPNGFVGNVLHGTSYTPFSSISKLRNYNCIRINYAGKLLFAIADGLSDIEKEWIGMEQNELKLKVCSLDDLVIEKSKKNIKEHLFNRLREIVDSGYDSSLSKTEIEWFKNDNVFLTDEDFEIICQKINKNRKKKISKLHDVIYLASMIEVTFEKFSNGLVSQIIRCGVNHFHVDIADGKYISRDLDGVEKLIYIADNYPNIMTHLHLMVANPFSENNGTSLLTEVCKIKKSLVYLHTDAYNFADSWIIGAQKISELGSMPGVVYKVDEELDLNIILEKMVHAQIHHILIMGVPIGRGGQTFKPETINVIRKVKLWSDNNSYKITIEVDGGLSDEVIPSCIEAGAEYLAGWSFFLKYGVENIEKRIEELING